MKKETAFSHIRAGYILLYLAFIAITEMVSVRVVLEGTSIASLISNLLAVSGVLLLLVDFCTRRVIFKPRYCGILLLFMLSMVISSLINIQYGIADNIKTWIWSAIQIFLVASVDIDLPKETHEKHFRFVMNGLSWLWAAAVIWSLQMFVVHHQGVIQLDGMARVRYEGFCEARLYGVFLDPNYAAMFSFVLIAYAVLRLYAGKTGKWAKWGYGVSILLNYLYIILSGSRTVELSLYAAIFLAALWLLWTALEKRTHWALSIVGALVCACLCVGAAVGVFYGAKKALSYVPGIYTSLQPQEPVDPPEENPEGSSVETPEETPEETEPTIGSVSMERPDVVGKEDVSNNRLAIWTDYIKALPHIGLFGTSPRTILAYMEDHFDDLYVLEKQYGPHNAFLMLFVCTGLPGGLLVMAFLVLVVVEVLGYLIRRRRQQDSSYRQVMLLTLCLIMFAFCGMSYAILFFNNLFVTIVFWLLLGYLRALVHLAESDRAGKRPLPYRLAEKVWAMLFKKGGSQ